MIPIVAGLGAAFVYTLSVLASARASRMVGAPSSVAWAMTVGFGVALPIAVATNPSPDFGGTTWIWFVLAGLGNVVGLLLNYAAFRIGAVAVVITICSTEGAIAALIALHFGESLAPQAGLLLAVVAIGVIVTASAAGSGAEGRPINRSDAIRAGLLSTASAVSLGVGLYSSGRLSTLLPTPWAIMGPRTMGFLVLAIPLVLLRRNRLNRAAAPFVVLVGLSELGGAFLFNLGAKEAIAITAVLSTLFAPISSVAALLLFRERLAVRQVIGIAVIVIGVLALGAVQR